MLTVIIRYDEFYYQDSSWDYPRRVVVKVEKPYNQLTCQYSFIVTNMDLTPEEILKYYRNRGTMENFIKETKSGFGFASTGSKSKVVNANRHHSLKAAKGCFKNHKSSKIYLFQTIQ